MDRLSFVFSLLLILSVTTTFASVIKAKNPVEKELEGLRLDADSSPYHEMPRNPKELESILKRSHGPKSLREQDSEKPQTRILSSEVVDPPLTDKMLQEYLDRLPSVSPKVAIGIENESTDKWTDPSTYMSDGTVTPNLPYDFENGKVLLFGALGSAGSAAGCLAYYISSIDKTIAVMWSDDPLGHENKWIVHLYNEDKKADYDMLVDLYYNQYSYGPSDEFISIDLPSGLKANGRISSSPKAKLQIYVERVPEVKTKVLA